MSDERVVAFRDALQASAPGAAIERFDGFDDALDRQSDRESAVRDVARGVLARTAGNRPSNAAAQQYLQRVFDAQQARIQGKYDFMLYLHDGPSASAVASKIDTVIAANEAVSRAEDELRQRSDGIPLPDIVRVLGPSVRTVPKGESFQLQYTVVNVGTTDVSGLDINVDGFDATVDPTSIETLPAGSGTNVTVTGTATTSENGIITMTVGDTRAQTRIVVLDKGDYLERLEEQFRETKSEIDEAASLTRSPDDDEDEEDDEDSEDEEDDESDSGSVFREGGIQVAISASVEDGVLSIQQSIDSDEEVEISVDVDADDGVTREQVAAAYLAAADILLGLAQRALRETEESSTVDGLIRAFAAQLRAASDVLSPSTDEDDEESDDEDDDEEGEGDEDDGSEEEGDDEEEDDEDDEDAETRPTTLSKRQLAIFAQDLQEIVALAVAVTRAQR